MSHWIINSGKNPRREYQEVNFSPLFQGLPEQDYVQEQKLSYSKFLFERLPQLLSFYFPAEFSNYNNKIKINIKDIEYQEPSIKKEFRSQEIEVELKNQTLAEDLRDSNGKLILKKNTVLGEENLPILQNALQKGKVKGVEIFLSEKEARNNSLTWNYIMTFIWEAVWNCERMHFSLVDNDLKESINEWIKVSFKIGKFTCEKKSFSKKELKSLLTETKKQLEGVQNQKQEKLQEEYVLSLTSKIEALEKEDYQEWEINEQESKKKKGKWKTVKDNSRNFKARRAESNNQFSLRAKSKNRILPFAKNEWARKFRY